MFYIVGNSLTQLFTLDTEKREKCSHSYEFLSYGSLVN